MKKFLLPLCCLLFLVFCLPNYPLAQEASAKATAEKALFFPKLGGLGRALTPEQAAAMEKDLLQAPKDLGARAQLLGYYTSRTVSDPGFESAVVKKRKHVLWIIEHAPKSGIFELREIIIRPSDDPLADPAGYSQAKALLLKQQKKHSKNAQVMANTGMFFMFHDKPLAIEAFAKAHRLDKDNRTWPAYQGMIYAMGILGITGTNPNGIPTRHSPKEMASAMAKTFRQDLDKSTDPRLLGAAGAILFQYGMIVSSTSSAETLQTLDLPEKLTLAERLLKKAKSMDTPNAARYDQMLAQMAEMKSMMKGMGSGAGSP